MTTTTKITAYRNLTTGETAPAHDIGANAEGRRIYRSVEGWEPVEPYDTDSDGNWMEAAPKPKKTLTITMSERRPLKIDPALWPVVAEAEWYNGQHRSQANTIRQIKVREHADGRRIVYGLQKGGNGGQHRGTRNPEAGYLIDPVRGDTMREGADGKMTAAHPDEAETIRAIRRVAGVIGDDDLGAECIGDLPAEEV